MQPNPKTTEYLKSLQALTLDEGTKARMRDALDAYVDLHTIQAPLPKAAARSPFFSYSFTRYGSFALALVLLVTGTGAAYASEGSVPGNPLYKVKVAVIEPVQGALITSPRGQASWHANLASRRLEEATTLAAANKFDESSQEYLQEQFEAQVASSNQAADVLADAGKAEEALEARSDLEARMTAHAQILGLVSVHLAVTAGPDDPSLMSTNQLLAAVETHRGQAVSARLALEDTGRTDSPSPMMMLSRTSGTAAKVSTLAAPEETSDTDDSDAEPMAAQAVLTKAQQVSDDSEPSSNKVHEEERAAEVASILLKHAKLLNSLMGTTATTTATSTQATTTDSALEEEIQEDFKAR